MKKNMLKLLTCFVFLGVIQQTNAQENQEAMMEAWTKYMTPGPFHAMLAKDNGAWDGEITFWEAEGAAPNTSKGKVVNSMILGGRYQQGIYSGNFGGMPMEGMSITGYDNATKKVISTWIDNFGTGIMVLEGTWNDATKTIELSGNQTDPMTGKPLKVREVLTFIDDNTQKMEMFMTVDGKEFKSMQLLLKRSN